MSSHSRGRFIPQIPLAMQVKDMKADGHNDICLIMNQAAGKLVSLFSMCYMQPKHR